VNKGEFLRNEAYKSLIFSSALRLCIAHCRSQPDGPTARPSFS